MFSHTRRHFAHAVKVLEAGKDLAKEQAQSRSYYEHDGKYTHDECRVTMWGQATVPCWDIENERSAHVQLSINVVTEYTSAQDVLDLAWVLLTALGYRQMTDIERDQVATAQPVNSSHNAPQSHETTRSSDLQSSQVSTQAPDENGVIYMGQWDDRKPEYLGMINRVVSFDVGKISGKLENGVANWSIYPVLSNGKVGQYPMSYVYSDGKYNANGLVEALTEIAQPGGLPVEGQYRAIGKIAKKKKKDGTDGLTFYVQAIEDATIF